MIKTSKIKAKAVSLILTIIIIIIKKLIIVIQWTLITKATFDAKHFNVVLNLLL